jgi:hypothetical protein
MPDNLPWSCRVAGPACVHCSTQRRPGRVSRSRVVDLVLVGRLCYAARCRMYRLLDCLRPSTDSPEAQYELRFALLGRALALGYAIAHAGN